MNDGLLWLDLETTGIAEDAELLEVAMRSSDMRGVIVDEGCDVVIHHDTLPPMTDDIGDMHESNGLLRESLDGGYGLDECARILRRYVESAMSMFDVVYLAGYSVSFDRAVLARTMPDVLAGIVHHMLDVTTLNIMAYHLAADVYRHAPIGDTDHRAPHCIRMEMDRYRYYLSVADSAGMAGSVIPC